MNFENTVLFLFLSRLESDDERAKVSPPKGSKRLSSPQKKPLCGVLSRLFSLSNVGSSCAAATTTRRTSRRRPKTPPRARSGRVPASPFDGVFRNTTHRRKLQTPLKRHQQRKGKAGSSTTAVRFLTRGPFEGGSLFSGCSAAVVLQHEETSDERVQLLVEQCDGTDLSRLPSARRGRARKSTERKRARTAHQSAFLS